VRTSARRCTLQPSRYTNGRSRGNPGSDTICAMVETMVIDNDAATSAAVRAEVARAGRTHKSVGDAAGIPPSRWQRRMRSGAWTIVELRSVARVLDIPLERLTEER
jgi:anti-sigma factor ChrR (cupin superfamily)